MTKKKTSLAPFEQTAYQRAELAAFRRMLTLSEGTFSLSIAVCNSPTLRDHLIAHITQESKGIQIVRIGGDTLDILDSVRQQIGNQSPEAVFVADIDRALKEENRDRVIQGLNSSRESWKSQYHCPVVFWLPEYASALLATQARDLWSWISHTFEFVSEQATAMEGMKDLHAGNTSMAGNLDAHEKQFRIAELEQRIASIDDSPSGTLIGHALVWLNELAYLHQSIGNLDQAETIHKQSLEINKRLGRREGMAIQYGNLGLIYRRRGDLDQAETMHNQALEIDKKLDQREGMASDYGNLGNVYLTRGHLDQAEAVYKQSLEIEKELGQLKGMASAYGNLGLIYLIRGDLDRAENMLNQALEINQKLGRLEGMAIQYGNLGLIYEQRGDMTEAREYWTQALALFQQIGMPHMVERIKGWIDGLSA